MEKITHLTFASDIESSDLSRRIIAGVVLPFNKIGNGFIFLDGWYKSLDSQRASFMSILTS